MRSPTWLVVVLLAATATAGSAQNAQTILPLDSPLAPLVKSLLLEQGKEQLSSAGPWSLEEIALMLGAVDPAALSPAGQRAWEELRSALRSDMPAEPMALRAAVHPEASAEIYLHTNQDQTVTRWQDGYSDRLPLFELPIDVWIGNGIYTTFDAALRQNHDGLDPQLVPGNVSNWTFNFDVLDYQIPQRAFLAAGGPHWSFVLGRDRFSWGNGQTGNLLVSDAPDFNDYARLTAYWANFKYTALWIMLNYGLDQNFRFPAWGPAGDTTVGQDYPRNLFIHRLDFLFWNRLSVSASEGILIGGIQPDLVYLNPVMIYHSLFRWGHASSTLSLEVGLNPWKYVELYGQAAYNQIQTPFELIRYGTGAAETPNAAAYLGGVRSRIPLWLGYLDAGFEAVFVGPWMYLRENQLISYEWWRRMNSNVAGSPQWVSSPVGYFTGPDALVFSVWAGYDVSSMFSVGLDFKRVAKGEQGFDTPYAEDAAAIALMTPTGVPEYTDVLHFSATWDPLAFLRVSTSLYWISVANFSHVAGTSMTDLQATLSVTVHADF